MSCAYFDSPEDPKSPECPECPEPRECPGSPGFPVSHVDPMSNGQGERNDLLAKKDLKGLAALNACRHATRRGHNGFSSCVT